TVIFYRDADGDGWGNEAQLVFSCPQPEGYVLAKGDCDDTRADVHPDAEEICNGIDDDCDQHVDNGDDASIWFVDADGDGYGHGSSTVRACEEPDGYVDNAFDCDDANPHTHLDAPEICDGEDNDCDGDVDEELAGEGESCAASSCV